MIQIPPFPYISTANERRHAERWEKVLMKSNCEFFLSAPQIRSWEKPIENKRCLSRRSAEKYSHWKNKATIEVFPNIEVRSQWIYDRLSDLLLCASTDKCSLRRVETILENTKSVESGSSDCDYHRLKISTTTKCDKILSNQKLKSSYPALNAYHQGRLLDGPLLPACSEIWFIHSDLWNRPMNAFKNRSGTENTENPNEKNKNRCCEHLTRSFNMPS